METPDQRKLDSHDLFLTRSFDGAKGEDFNTIGIRDIIRPVWELIQLQSLAILRALMPNRGNRGE